jgi:hypothetical protein
VAAVLLLVLPWWIPKLLAARQPSTR